MASSSSRRSPSPRRRSRHSPSPHRHSRRPSSSPSRNSSHRDRRRSRSPSESSHRSSRRRRSRSRSESRDSRHHHSGSSSRRRRHSSVSPYCASSGSSSEDDRRKKRREHKKHKKDKKSKKHKKKSKKSSKVSTVEWGKYGIIHEADIFTKEAEFQAWLIEVKNANVETLNNIKRKEMFIDFMEDYNTATMPHEKFYNLHQWERRQESIRMGEKPLLGGGFDFQKDEEKLRMQHRQAARAAASKQPTLQLSTEQIEELTRVNRERVEADRMRKMGLKPKDSMGVRYESGE